MAIVHLNHIGVYEVLLLNSARSSGCNTYSLFLSAISNRDVKAPETVAAATDFLFDLLFAL
jgi:hypothetical protein